MVRLARCEIFDPDIVACVHVMARVVRRCFLLGDDEFTGKNYDHRKLWIEEQLKRLAANFGIDLLCFSILSNHFHLILRSRPDVVAAWDDTEVARRWLMLCPMRKYKNKMPMEPNEVELNTIRNDPVRLQHIRKRLSDIAWWMRLLCQNIASRANKEDREIGKFWQSRYKSVRILDEETLLACAAYVDLNPIRSAMAETIEQSDFTSVQRRVQSVQSVSPPHADASPVVQDKIASREMRPSSQSSLPDDFLSPVTIDERNDPIGPHSSTSGKRCSDKGFLAMTPFEYLEVLDWAARMTVANKRGSTPTSAPPILERLGVDMDTWSLLVQDFGRLFSSVAGKARSVSEARSLKTHRRFYQRSRPLERLGSS